MPNWTNEQKSAIQARNPSLLIAAAAGSGKTAVLVERIVALIREGCTMDRMMIVTFTRAAAAEMRERLTRRLLQEAERDPATFAQSLDDLDRAVISTIHAFCQKVLRSEFQAVGVDPLARVVEAQQQKRLFQQAFHTALDQLLSQQHPEVTYLAQSYSLNELVDMVNSAYTFLMAMPDPFQWYAFHVERLDDPMEKTAWYQYLMGRVREQMVILDALLEGMRWMMGEPDATPAYQDVFDADTMQVNALKHAAGMADEAFLSALAGVNWMRLPTKKAVSEAEKAWREEFKKQRGVLKDAVADLKAMLLFDRDALAADMAAVKTNTAGLGVLIHQVHQAFREEKRQLSLLDFHDLEQFTLEVLRQPALRQRLQAGFDHLFVDECQDVSAIQDEIIQLLHVEHPGEASSKSPTLFMVGDVKQSIYRFRQADPTRFLERMRSWGRGETEENRAIFLQKNFRSTSSVLEGVNVIFRQIMRKEAAELDYLPEDELIPGATFEETPPVEIHLIHEALSKAEDGMEKLAAQVEVVIGRLTRLLGTPIQEGDTMRPLTYRDVVILMPTVAGKGGKVAEMLSQRGIPVFFDGSDSYFTQREILAVLAILRTVDNPLQDVPLLTTLKGEPFHFTDDDLAAIRLMKPDRGVPFHQAFTACCETDTPLGARCRAVNDTISRWRFRRETLGLHGLIWMILHESGLYAAYGALPEGGLRQANLRLLVDRAVAFESTGETSLGRFLAVVDDDLKIKDSDGAKVLQAHENLVRIMTIHKSKGLEFPVVFVLGMGDRKRRDNESKLVMHPRLGVAMPCIHPIQRTYRKTPAMTALSLAKVQDERAELMRLLYVAMTRPKHRLILVGQVSESTLLLTRAGASLGTIHQAPNMMAWVLLGISQGNLAHALNQEKTLPPPADDPMEGIPVGEQALFRVSLYTQTDASAQWEEPQVDYAHKPWADLAAEQAPPAPPWPAMPPSAPPVPLKTSVTSLVKQQLFTGLVEVEPEETAETKQQPEIIVSPLRMPDLPEAPRFITGETKRAVHRGSVMHLLLALLDLPPLRGLATATEMVPAIHGQLEKCRAQGVFTAEEAAWISPATVATFLLSPLGQRIICSPRVEREWSFVLRMPQLRNTILQGVIDCAFLEETDGQTHWVVVDYKTDHIRDEVAFQKRYRQQLQYYAHALATLTGTPVKENILYSLEKMQPYVI